jgi:hypothetical protein
MTFKVDGGGKVIEGTITVPDDDGTTHLPMMIHGLMKQVVESVPALLTAKSITITADLNAENANCDATRSVEHP